MAAYGLYSHIESNKRRSIVLQVFRQPGTNTVQIVDRINALLPQLRAQLPAAVNLDVFYDRSQSIRASVNDVKFTLVLSVGLVVLVIFIFLRNVSATIVQSGQRATPCLRSRFLCLRMPNRGQDRALS